MRAENARGYFEYPGQDGNTRYLLYFHNRLPKKQGGWYWHWWREPAGEVLPFHTGLDWNPWDAGLYGLWINPYEYPEEKWERYRRYYQKRMPWRRWSLSSARCHAARNGYRVEEYE